MEKRVACILSAMAFAMAVQAQRAAEPLKRSSADAIGPQKEVRIIPKKASANVRNIARDYEPSLLLREMPRQGAKKMVKYEELPHPSSDRRQSIVLDSLNLGMSLLANLFNVNTPNDNDIAVSDSGMIMSVINSIVYVRNAKTNMLVGTRSLAAFTQTLSNPWDKFDPKVIYDPGADRFIFACIAGFVDTANNVIVGFSQSNDPFGSWNFYELPGDALGNHLWSDYPMIGISQKELFLSVNLLYNDSSWQTGFVETIVWQMAKDSGYAGKNLNSALHHNIKHNGRSIRNLCPVKGGSKPYGPNMYFLSNRNLASSNDTVFLVNLTNLIGSPNNSITVQVLKTNAPYRFPPDARQTLATQSLATNDCRNLGAFFENDKIQYVHNTKHYTNNRPTVHYGVIHNVSSGQPTIVGYQVPNDSLDFGYPNISYSGLDSADNGAIITFDHTSDKVKAGCSALEADANGNFSPILRIKDGTSYIDLLAGNLERWGDYSGSQRKYNHPGEVWMSGYCGYSAGSYPRAHGAWVAQLTTEKSQHVGLREEEKSVAVARVFPNPATDRFSVDLELGKPEYLSFELYDAQGRLMQVLLRDWVKTNKNTFSFTTKDLGRGVYILKVKGNAGTEITKKVVVN